MRELRHAAALLSIAGAAVVVGCASATPAPLVAGADGRMRVTVELDDFAAFESTEGERRLGDVATGLIYGSRFFSPGDEIWFVVAGRDPAGGEFARTLPDDELFWTLFSNPDAEEERENDLPPQELWRGTLGPGERTELTVVALEHDGARADDAEPGKVPDTVIASMRRAHAAARTAAVRLAAETTAADSLVGTVAPIASALDALLASGTNQLVGAFAVRVGNEDGRLVAEWRTLSDAKDRGHNAFSRGRPLKPRMFQLRGSGSRYEAAVRVSAMP
jgi:hypothetical protein